MSPRLNMKTNKDKEKVIDLETRRLRKQVLAEVEAKTDEVSRKRLQKINLDEIYF